MNRLCFWLAVVLAGTWPCIGYAADNRDYFKSDGTQPVALTGGDTPNTYSVGCSSVTATSLRPAVTNRSRRKICFQNRGSVTVVIGSSTVIATDLWTLGESTNSATSPQYCTNNSGAFFCGGLAGSTTSQAVVQAIEEVQSVP